MNKAEYEPLNEATNEPKNEPSAEATNDITNEAVNDQKDDMTNELECGTDQADAIAAADVELDNELSTLFAAFDDVRASDSLKARTLDRLSTLMESGADDPSAPTDDLSAEKPANETHSGEAAIPAAIEAKLAQVKEAPENSNPASAQSFSAVEGAKSPQGKPSGTKARRAKKFRAIRIAAIAACLSLALVGGVAYATPTSHVQLSQGDASIELGVNRFGVVVSATSNDDAGRAVIEKGGLLNVSYDDALAHAADGLGKPTSDRPLEATVNSNDGAQRENLENKNREFLNERNESWGPTNAPSENNPGGMPADHQPAAGEAPSEEPPNGTMQPGEASQPGTAPSNTDQPENSGQPSYNGQPESGANQSETNDQPRETAPSNNADQTRNAQESTASETGNANNDGERSSEMLSGGDQPLEEQQESGQPEEGQSDANRSGGEQLAEQQPAEAASSDEQPDEQGSGKEQTDNTHPDNAQSNRANSNAASGQPDK